MIKESQEKVQTLVETIHCTEEEVCTVNDQNSFCKNINRINCYDRSGRGVHPLLSGQTKVDSCMHPHFYSCLRYDPMQGPVLKMKLKYGSIKRCTVDIASILA